MFLANTGNRIYLIKNYFDKPTTSIFFQKETNKKKLHSFLWFSGDQTMVSKPVYSITKSGKGNGKIRDGSGPLGFYLIEERTNHSLSGS